MTEMGNTPLYPPTEPSMTPKPASNLHNKLWLAISVPAILILAMLAFFAGSYYSSQKSPAPTPAPGQLAPIDNGVVIEDTETPSTSDVTPAEVTSTAENLVIEWNDPQRLVTGSYYLTSVVYSDYQGGIDQGLGPQFFGLGTVSGGVYDNYQLTLSINGLPGMGTYYEWYYLLMPPNDAPYETKAVLLDRYAYSMFFMPSTPYESARKLLGEQRSSKLDSRRIVIDATAKIAELEYQTTTTDTEGRKYHAVGVMHRDDYPVGIDIDAYPTVATLSNGAKLHQAGETFKSVRADHAIMYWDLDVPFLTPLTDEGAFSYSTGVPMIYWNDGTANTKKYTKASFTGCGGGPTAVLDSALVTPNALKVAGSVGGGTAAGEKVYEWTNLDNERTREIYRSIYWQDDPAMTYEQFAATKPLFYYHDAFDRWIEFRTIEAIPNAECGKPVIYLYPETTTDLDVTLAPQGGFSYSKPAYNNGWSVTASPDGTLVNKIDGKTYPYLFWEGRGGMYAEPQNYWVVAQGDVDAFLNSTLAKLGLNDKETADFIEFWAPRMKAAPYYKIGFHGTQVMNQLAPMSISQAPDSVLRILMDYSELSAPIAENPPRLPATFKRDGFTVVEWGGVLR